MQGTGERCSVTILQQLTKEDTEQTCRENNTGKIYNDQIAYTVFTQWTGATHSDTHSDKINPVEWQRTFAAMEGGS